VDFKIIIGLILGIIIGILAASLIPAAAPAPQPQCPNSLDAIKKRGVLVLGTSADWPPYEYVEGGAVRWLALI